jgi:mannose-6-phosphate isomerase
MDKAVHKELGDIDSFVVVMCLSGHGTLLDSEPVFDSEGRRGPTKGHLIPLRQGETVLIPASSIGVTFSPAAGGMKVLTSYIK